MGSLIKTMEEGWRITDNVICREPHCLPDPNRIVEEIIMRELPTSVGRGFQSTRTKRTEAAFGEPVVPLQVQFSTPILCISKKNEKDLVNWILVTSSLSRVFMRSSTMRFSLVSPPCHNKTSRKSTAQRISPSI